MVRFPLHNRKSKRTRGILDVPRPRRRRKIMVRLPQTLDSRVAEVCSHFPACHPGALPDTSALRRLVSRCDTLAQAMQQVEILALVRGLQGGSVKPLIQFLSGVLGPDGIQADAMAWRDHGRTVVSIREYFVNVEDNLGRRLQ